ncbi:hypothetical protein ACOJIV_24085 [Haloarcula sp. AONF1]
MTKTDPDRWERIGRDLAAQECGRRRAAVDDELYALERTIREGDDVDAEDIEDARHALNALRRLLEDQLAPVAGVEPWGSPPDMPYGAVVKHYRTDDCDDATSTAGGDG